VHEGVHYHYECPVTVHGKYYAVKAACFGHI
jgi:hypothetical protein